MRVLVVGDGALGQVFGLGLGAGGASVHYLVKHGRTGWGETGRVLYRLRRPGKPVVQELRPDGVHDEFPDGPWDMVWLCVSSTALREPWVRDLRERIGDATVVTIGQDLHDRAVLAQVWPEQQIVQIVPSVFAYSAPLKNEVPAPGIAYWLPPGSAMDVIGDRARVDPVVTALNAGNLRARPSDKSGSGERIAATTMPFIAALEAANWSMPTLMSDLGPAAEASTEASAIVAAQTGGKAGRTQKWVAKTALRVIPLLAPFDVPRYLQAHFTKVGDQTRLMLDGWISEGESRDLPVTRLRELRKSL